MISRILLSMLFACVLAPEPGCDRKSAKDLQGQRNADIIFFAKVVDQEGKPLSGASFQFRVEAYPADWTFETRGRPYVESVADAKSDSDGRFEIVIHGCLLYRLSAEKQGYRQLVDEDTSGGSQSTNAIHLISWGLPYYKSDRDNPAIFVFVKDGIKEVSALPCRGGADTAGVNKWIKNSPAWPIRPSLKDVVYKPASTQRQ